MITQLERGWAEEDIRCIYARSPVIAFVSVQVLIPLEGKLTVRSHWGLDNEPRCESAEVRRAADTGWHQLRTGTSTFKTAIPIMPGAPSPTRCPGQLSVVHLSLRTWNIHTLSWTEPPLFPDHGVFKYHQKNSPGQRSCFLQVPILSLPTPPSVQIKVAAQMLLLLGNIEVGDNGIHLHLMGTQEGPSTLM